MNEEQNYNYYIEHDNYFSKFLKRNPEFNNEEFRKFVERENKSDRDSGELMDIAKHEILRLAYEWIEHKWRFPNCHNRKGEWNK